MPAIIKPAPSASGATATSGAPAPRTTARAALSEKQKQSLIAAARAELAPASVPILTGRILTWDDLARVLPKLRVPAYFREEAFNKLAWESVRTWYINTAEQRALDEAAALAAKSAAVEIVKLNVQVDGVKFRPQQRKAIDEVVAAYNAGVNGAWVPLPTGRGKTFVAGGIISYFKSQGLLDNDNLVFPPVFFFTKKQVLVPTVAKLRQYFGLRCSTDAAPSYDASVYCAHYQALSTKRWSSFYKKVARESFGNLVEDEVWVPREKITLIFLDECHECKKIKSRRTKRIMGIARAARAAGRRVFWIFMSATNATTLDDTRLFNYCTGLCEDDDSTAFLSRFLSPVKGARTSSKIKKQMDDYVKHIGHMFVRPPNDPLDYKIHNKIEIINFPSEREEEFYRRAEQDYIDSIEAVGGEVKNLDMAKFTIFRGAAEYCKVPWMVAAALEREKQGRSVILAFNFKRSMLRALSILAEHGIGRDNISIVKGPDRIIQPHEVYGDVEYANLLARQDLEVSRYREQNEGAEPDDPWFFLTKKEKAKKNKTRRFNQEMVRAGETRSEQHARVAWLTELELGTQTDETRHREVQNYLDNRTHFFLFTSAAGGTGIDADDRVPGGRPRTTITGVSYTGEEWIQVFGRDARVTTLTDVEHIIVMFDKSIETEHVLPRLAGRLDSMSAMTGGNGDLEGLMMQSIAKSKKRGDFAAAKSMAAVSEDLVVDEGTDDDEDDDGDDED
jgi:hypothetical protein